MADLQKIVKLTQAQYTTLASGGTVGSYTGLNDNYVYLVENNVEYLPTTGGTITGNLTIEGNLEVDTTTNFYDTVSIHNSAGMYFIDGSNNTLFALGADEFSSEIIYIPDNTYKPLLANDSDAIIYSQNDDYLQDITLNTGVLTILDDSDTGNSISFDTDEGFIYHNRTGTNYYAALPESNGTIALTSDITVTDVKINNTSIVSSKVANFNTQTAYNASTNKIATMSDIPTVNNATLTIQQNGITVNTFTANASSNVTANIETPQVKRFI